MTGVITRMNRLRSLLLLRHGPGAAVLPPDVTRIHIEFGMTNNMGHKGPRHFWKKYLPSLKYWNPSIPMIVNRVREQRETPTMTLYFREGGADATAEPEASEPISSASDGRSKAPPPRKNERIVTIDMKFQTVEQIAEEFLRQTGAKRVKPTPQEEDELREDELRQQRGEVDRAMTAKVVAEKRREDQLLRQARNEVAAMRATA